jgi:hypothetical protein
MADCGDTQLLGVLRETVSENNLALWHHHSFFLTQQWES